MKSSKLRGVVLTGILFLFFFQLIADFIEATYVFGLLGGSFPMEGVSVLLILSPVLLVLFRNGLSRWALVSAGLLMLLCRVAEPLLDTRGQMMVSGLGVACFMILLPSLLLNRNGERGEVGSLTLGIGLTLGLSLSVLFRTLFSGRDLSTMGMFQIIGWFLAAIAGYLMVDLVRDKRAPRAPSAGAEHPRPSWWRVLGLSVGTISVLVLLYFSFSSPTVIARWTGANYPLIVSLIALALSVFALLLAYRPRLWAALTPRVVLAWNILFVLSMVLTILAHQIRFPADPGAYPLSEPIVTALHHLPLVLMLVLFPVLLVDFMLLAPGLKESKPSSRSLGTAFTLAALLFLLMIFAQIFTTVYDYIPVVGPPLRDRFWLVFLVPGITLILSLPLVRRSAFSLDQVASMPRLRPLYPAAIALVSLITIGGAFLTAGKPDTAADPERTLKVLTYNILQGYSADGLENYDGQLAILRKADADVIGLQECDTTRAAGGNSDVVRFLADRLDMYAYYGPKTVVGTFGVALLSRYPIENPRTFYHYSEGEQEATIHARITVGDRTFNVYSTHLASEDSLENLAQQVELLGEVKGNENVILMGDFNFGPDEPEGQYELTLETLDDSWALRWPGVDKRDADPTGDGIDHIFVSPGTRVTDAEYVPGSESASDHPAVTIIIEW